MQIKSIFLFLTALISTSWVQVSGFSLEDIPSNDGSSSSSNSNSQLLLDEANNMDDLKDVGFTLPPDGGIEDTTDASVPVIQNVTVFTNDPTDKADEISVGAIAGIAGVVLLVLAVLAVVGYFCYNKNKQRAPDMHAGEEVV